MNARPGPNNRRLPPLRRIALCLAASACMSAPEVPQDLRAPLKTIDCSSGSSCIDFIYLHGSARPHGEHRDQFYEYTDVMHPWVMAEFYAKPETHAGLLHDDLLDIDPAPIKFYWGDMSSEEFTVVEQLLDWADERKGQRGTVARAAQSAAVLGMHDTFWIARPANKRKVHLALHAVVSESIARGHQVVLLGHSAGAMAAQSYAIYQMPYIDFPELAAFETDPEIARLFSSQPEKTCVRAALESGLFHFSNEGTVGLVLERETLSDEEQLDRLRHELWREKMAAMPEYTRRFCVPPGRVRGLITYGHPGPILEGTITGVERDFYLLFMRHVVESGIFWVNLNHTNDPVGYSMYDEADLPEALTELTGLPVTRGGGFFISGTESSGASVLTAHSWYWMKPAHFARVLAELYAEGYRNRFVTPRPDDEE